MQVSIISFAWVTDGNIQMDKLPINSNKEFLFPTIALAIYINEADNT